MKNPTEASKKPLRGVAALFDDFERKELFRKYLFFLGWVELLIFVTCWLFQLGDSHDAYGPVETSFPWKAYFLVSFLAPVAISFLIGLVIVGFNKYFAENEPESDTPPADAAEAPEEKESRIYKLHAIVTWVQRLPFLALLLLLIVAAGFFYKLDAILTFVGQVGEKSVKIFLVFGAVLVVLAAVFALVLIVLNFQLRKRSMAYQYKSEVAERFGLIILEDNSVINREGQLLISGKNGKDHVPLLPAKPGSAEKTDPVGANISRAIDVEVS